ncbi:hypothetical protein N0B31_14080 [Salinirubellus salinus]|uniref:Uncharacterized protein n=1 Tax=Salinirubellus salinus TaxID=1364945 RepID=A0A9E7U771_9EURY|nr:hypothetical protein [Salinirubellus salinus]UWM53266.1 hypothetical protein N0B31_14080 [Salinirubellus salinus]
METERRARRRTERPVAAGIVRAAERRVREELRERRRRGERVVTLAELAEATALDPNTAAAVMGRLEPAVRRIGSGECRWYLE